MNAEQAQAIILHLLSGVDPISGNDLPDESPLRHKEVMRALLLAARSIWIADDLKAAPAAHEAIASGAGVGTCEKQATPQIGPQARSRATLRAGLPWTAEEDIRLLQAFDRGMTVRKLARAHQRRQSAIRARLEKHGRAASFADEAKRQLAIEGV